MSRKKKESFIQRRIRKARRFSTFCGWMKRNRRGIKKAGNGICEVVARIMEKNL